jgi:hypothetical protein
VREFPTISSCGNRLKGTASTLLSKQITPIANGVSKFRDLLGVLVSKGKPNKLELRSEELISSFCAY